MNGSTRKALRQLELARLTRDEQRALTEHARLRFPIASLPTHAARVWQRAVAACVAFVLFAGPVSITLEQSRDAAGVLAAGSTRLDDDAWQQIRDLAALRVRFDMQMAQAAPITDPTVPITFQPKITQSTGANGGVPVVNITAPNAAGISLNQYQSFNIDPVGLILNNSLMSGTSLTGGDVQANANLAGRTASVIVNQVTSTGAAFASLLNGPLEVFGAPAAVIIANPNGITTRGTGFTNTTAVTLSTGTPQFLADLNGTRTDFAHAQAIGYSVSGGHIQIEGNAGVNGPGAGIEGTVGAIDLIGETIGINAPLYAGLRINAIAGRQFVLPGASDATGTTYTTAANGAANTAAAINQANNAANNGLAIDATAFGAMTAGQIQVISTAQGMGVRTDAQLAANTGDLLLSANGDVSIVGTAAQQQASVQSTGNVAMTGTHVGVGGYTINANGDVTSTGSIQSGGKLAVTAGGNVAISNVQAASDASVTAGSNVTLGDVQGGGALNIAAQGHDGAGDVDLNGTTVVTGATNVQAARDINVNGQTASGSLQASAQRDVNVGAALQTSGDLALTAVQRNVNGNANINSGGKLALSSGQDTVLTAQTTAHDDVAVQTGRDLMVGGSLASGSAFSAQIARDLAVTGSLLVGADAQVGVGHDLDVSGVVIVQQDGTFSAQNDITSTSAGSIAFGQSGALNAAHDVALAGKLLANGLQIDAANSVSLTDVQAGGAFDVAAHGVAGGGDVTFGSNAAAVGATQVQAARDVLVNGTLAGGAAVSLDAQRNVTVAGSGTVQSVDDLSIAARTGNVTSSGTINGAGNLNVQGAQDVALTGATSVTGDTTLRAGHDLTIGGSLAGQGGATLSAGHDVVAGGNSGFVKDTTVNAGNDLNVTGTWQGSAVTLDAGGAIALNNVQANGALQVAANGSDLTINGTVASLSTGTLSAARDIAVSSAGTLETANALSVAAGRDTSIAGTVQSNGDLSLQNAAGNLVSTGNIASGGNLSIDASQSVDLGTQTTAALGNLTVNAGQDLTMNGTLVAQGNGALNAGRTISGAAAAAFGLDANVTSGGDTNLTGSLRGATVETSAGGSATLHDIAAASTMSLAAAGDVNVTGAATGGDAVTLNAGQNIGVTGSLQSAANTTLTATNGNVVSSGTIASNGTLGVTAGTDIDLGGTTSALLDATLAATRDINVTGMLAGQGQGIVDAGRDIGGAGTLTFLQQATLNAGRDIAQGGLIQGQAVAVTAAGNASVTNVEAATTIALRADGTTGAANTGNLTVNGTAAAAGNVTASAQNDISVPGKIASGSTATVTAQRDIDIAGAVESVGDTVLTAQQGSLNATGGINSGGKLDIATGLDLSLGASTSAIGDVTLTAGRDALLNGTLIGGSNGTVTAGRDIGGAGTQAFAQAATYDAQHDIALTGGLQAQVVNATGGNNAALHDVSSATTLTLTANGNAGGGDAAVTGTASAAGAVNVSGARDVTVSGALGSGTTLTLAAQRDISVSGGVESAGDLTLSAATGSAAITGTAVTNGALNVTSALDTQLGGQIAVANQVSVQAGRDILLTGALAGQMDGSLNAARDISGAGSAAFASAANLTAAHDLALTGALQGATVTVTGGNNAGLGSVQAVSGDLNVTANGNAGGGDVSFAGTATALGLLTLQAARDISASGAFNAGGATTIEAARNIALADVNSAGALTIEAANGSAGAANVTTQGNLNANAAGALTFSGQTAVGGNATLASGGDMMLTGGIAAQNTGTLTSGGSLNAGSVAFGQQATLTAANSIAVTGDVATNGTLTATAGNSLAVGSAEAGDTVNLTAQGHDGTGDLSVTKGVTSGAATTLTGARDVTVGGAVTSNTSVTVSAGRNLGIGGAIGSNADTLLTATTGNLSVGGVITTLGNLNATAGGSLALLDGGLVNGDVNATSGGDMTLGGGLFGLGVANLTAGGSINGGGALTFGKDIGINAGGGIALGAIEDAGKLTAVSNGDMSFGAATVVGDVNATSHAGSVAFNGALQSGGNVQIQAANNAAVTGGVASTGAVNINGAAGNVTVGGVSSNGDATLHAGQTLTLTGDSVVAGELALTGGNVTLAGTASGSKDITVSAQGTVNAAQSTIVSSQNLQVNGANVTLGNAIVGGTLNAQASNQLTLAGSNVDVVGAATLAAGAGLYNASNVLAGGNLTVSAPSLTNAAGASLASVATTTINATNFTNAGLVNGATTNVTVAGALNNVGGSLMAVNGLTINTGTLDNQNGIIFAGNPNTPSGPVTGDVSLTINGGGAAFYNVGGQLLAQRNMGVSAVNATFDPSQGTISYGGQLSLTAGVISVGGVWNFGGQGATVVGLSGINNYGTITGTAPLSISTGGTFSNYGQLTGNDVTFSGTLSNAAGAVVHADDALTLNGNTTNRGTVEAGNTLTVNGGNYDNQLGTTQVQGNANFNLSGVLQNTGGTIIAGNNITITASAVINDRTPATSVTDTGPVAVDDPSFLWSTVVGERQTEAGVEWGPGVTIYDDGGAATLGDLLSPTGYSSTSAPIAGPGGTFTIMGQIFGTYSSGDGTNNETPTSWVLDVDHQASQHPGTSSATFTLPTVYEETTTVQQGQAGVISAGNNVSITAGTLSNRSGEIAAAGNLSLNVGALQNGAADATLTSSTKEWVDQAALNSLLSQLASTLTNAPLVQDNVDAGSPWFVGTLDAVNGGTTQSYPEGLLPTTRIVVSTNASNSITSTTTVSGTLGMLVAGHDLSVTAPGTLTNSGIIFAGNNIDLAAGTQLINQGGNQQNSSTQVGCAAGVPSSACGTGGGTRGSNPTTTTFGYDQNDATIYAGNDLVIAAGQINNTFGNLLAGHDIVIGGVGSTASSTTPAQSLNNTSGNIIAGNDITLNVSGAITNNLPPPVPVHENYGSQEQYSGCMTAGGYKESYCEGYVDQQSGSSSVISAGNNLQVNAGSLTNIGSLIAAGNSATISVAGPVVNEAQTLNAYWHSHWVQETGMFSSDKRHDTWACGSAEQCTQLYGSAYTNTGGAIDPPTPVGNIAATIQAPNLSITSNGQIQNVGNVIGTSVSLTGQQLINGITTANTYTPRVNAPSQVISLSPVNLPGLNLSTPRRVGDLLPTAVAGQAAFVDGSLAPSAIGNLGPQDLLNNLPSNLQPGSTLFYYNPQEEDVMLQQAALQQTGKASFIDGLSYDSTSGATVTEQEKAYLYQNAIDYAKTNNLQLGDALTQAQVSELDKPMLWYVEQTVPDPSCKATGNATCPTITALMPQVYLPSDTSAMSAGGNISGTDVTLNFNQDGNGSILNTGSISASDTLTVNTGTLTNQANQVDIGQDWSKVKGGYVDTTGTVVQPGGFMSAANMDLNVETLNQIGGVLQQLNADGTVDEAGTQQMLAQLQQQLGVNFTQTSVSDNLHTDFVKEGGGLPTFVVAAIAIAASIVTAGAAAAALGVVMTQLTVGSVLVGALGGMVGSIAGQLASGQGLNFGQILEAGAIGGLTAGAFAGLSEAGMGIGNLQGIAGKLANGTFGAADLGNALETIAARGVVSAGIDTAVYGGSFGEALEGSLIGDIGAVGAGAIGFESTQNPLMAEGTPGYVLAHAALGCVLSAADGTGCGGGAVGGAASAIATPVIRDGLYDGSETVTYGEDANGAPIKTVSYDNPALNAATASIAALIGGELSNLLGQNPGAGANWAVNEALNNSLSTKTVGVPLDTSAMSEAEKERYEDSHSVPVVTINDSGAQETKSGGEIVKSPPPITGGSSAGGAGSGATPIGGTGGGATNYTVVATFGPMNPGPLSSETANTFRSGTYTEMVAQQPTTLYRVYGGTADQMGGYWTPTPPAGPVQSTIDSALLPQWGNTATNVVKIEIPAGTTYFTGAAAPQGGLVGGGTQVVFPPGFKVNSSWIKSP